MKNINNTSLLNLIKSKGLILISSSFLLTSCVIYTGGYSETDGVYYDLTRILYLQDHIPVIMVIKLMIITTTRTPIQVSMTITNKIYKISRISMRNPSK
jgi:uncharacterized membrane protein YjdF